MQPIQIYELVTGERRYFSPFCWATRLAVTHKNIPVETVPWKFRQQDKIAFSGQDLVRKRQLSCNMWLKAVFASQGMLACANVCLHNCEGIKNSVLVLLGYEERAAFTGARDS